MENIKFSIIIPAYNSEKYIEKCLENIIKQTYKNIEIIVVDDCSTDGTLKILEKYNQIKLYKTKVNSRQGAARNIGLEYCTGDYILFIDADDYLYDINVIEKIADRINKSDNPDIVYLGMKIEGKRNLELIPNEENCKKEYRLAENPFINVINICWKKSLIEENNIRFPEQIRYEDVYFAFVAIEKAKTYAFADFIYYIYNNRDESTTTDYSIKQAYDTLKLIEELFKLEKMIDKENIPYLEMRIKQQAERAKVRLDRAIESEIKRRAN